jgi:hypothetical protein
MTIHRSQTKEWLPWFYFPSKQRVECVFCKKPMSYRRDRCLEHYGYQTNPEKLLRVICTKMPVAVRERFKHCDNVVPGRMTHVEMYGTLAASSGATQPVQTPPSIHSGDTNGNGGFQDGEGGPVQEPLQSCQERSRGDSCNPRPLCQQQFSKAYHITKRKELDEKWAAFFY